MGEPVVVEGSFEVRPGEVVGETLADDWTYVARCDVCGTWADGGSIIGEHATEKRAMCRCGAMRMHAVRREGRTVYVEFQGSGGGTVRGGAKMRCEHPAYTGRIRL